MWILYGWVVGCWRIVCVCVCVCVYVCVVHVCACVRVSCHVDLRGYVRVCMHAFMCAYVCIFVCTYLRMYEIPPPTPPRSVSLSLSVLYVYSGAAYMMSSSPCMDTYISTYIYIYNCICTGRGACTTCNTTRACAC